MKIGIDARLYGLTNRGLGRYVQNLVEEIDQSLLQNQEDHNKYLVFLGQDNFHEWQSVSGKITKVLLPLRWYSLKEQLLGARLINKHRIDLMHFTHFNVPYFYSGRFMVTIHDLTINRFPDSRATTLPFWLYKIKLFSYRFLLKRTLQRAEKIICPSNFVKEDLLQYYHLPANKIEVIYEGAEKIPPVSSNLDNFKITKPYLLYVGAAYPHKNLDFLAEAFIKFNTDNNYQLVLAGRLDFFYTRLKNQLKNNPDIIFTGEVSDGELASLYQRALFFVFPSLNEGFGLPPLEAQANNCPVLSSNTSCLPEILQNSVLYFNPANQTKLVEQMRQLAKDESLRLKLQEAGRLNSARFSWPTMAETTLKLYH